MPAALEMIGVTKRFGHFVANDRVDFSAQEGEIHALLGENGAGKSTLMNVLGGLYALDEGTVRLFGRSVRFRSPRDAARAGVGMVHQHFMLVPTLTVAENIVLGSEPRRGPGLLDRGAAERRVHELSTRHGLDVEPHARVGDLTVSQQQRVEILKVLYRDARVLILDEPTAVLAPQEVEQLYGVLRSLAATGRTIIFITHKLREVRALANRVTVLRAGRVAGSVPAAGMTDGDLVEMMVGRAVNLHLQSPPQEPGEQVLLVEDLCVPNQAGRPAVRGVTLTVRAGEIVGLAGVDGNGQAELIEAIAGLRPVDQGRIVLDGRDLARPPARALRQRLVGHIPEDRHRRGLVLDFNMVENFLLGSVDKEPYARGLHVDYEQARNEVTRAVAEYEIRTPGIMALARHLSGGNQQKLVAAREVARSPRLLVAAQPTRGLDIGATEFLRRRLLAERANGRAILLYSLDLEELLDLSDRIAVMREGRIVGMCSRDVASAARIGELMVGGAGRG